MKNTQGKHLLRNISNLLLKKYCQRASAELETWILIIAFDNWILQYDWVRLVVSVYVKIVSKIHMHMKGMNYFQPFYKNM